MPVEESNHAGRCGRSSNDRIAVNAGCGSAACLPQVRRRAAPRRPEAPLLFLILRPRDTGDMRRMVGLGAVATASWPCPPVAAVADTGIELDFSAHHQAPRGPSTTTRTSEDRRHFLA